MAGAQLSSGGLSIDRYVDVASLVHRADARLKCGGTVVFIAAVTSLPVAGWMYLGAFCAGVWLLALMSRIGLARTFKRSLIAVPFLVVAVPTIFTFEGRTLQSWDLGVITLTPTYEGLIFVATIMWKGWIAVTASVVLASTTRYLDISAALRWFRVPALLVAVMEMMYRYVFLLGAEGRRMLAARRSRSAAAPGLKFRRIGAVAGEGDGSDGRFAFRQDSEPGGASAHWLWHRADTMAARRRRRCEG